jgi:hypothetical protein
MTTVVEYLLSFEVMSDSNPMLTGVIVGIKNNDGITATLQQVLPAQ